MAIPKFDQVFRPILAMLDVSETALTRQEITASLAVQFSLTEEELRETIPSGVKTRLRDRTDWAITDLKDAGLIDNSPQNQWRITLQGRNFLKEYPAAITRAELKQVSTKPVQVPEGAGSIVEGMEELTPGEQIAQGYQELQVKLSSEILDSLKKLEPDGFERLVVDLLSKMGYGDGQVTGRSGDQGIDGILDEDTLGLEKVYVQAKRYDGHQVIEREIRNFSGSLDRQGAAKGVFITTSTFSPTARQAARDISMGNKSVRLVDGQELAQLMMRHGVGVVTESTYVVQKLDANYFAEV